MQININFDDKDIKNTILFLVYDEILQCSNHELLNDKNLKEDIIIKLSLYHLGRIYSRMKDNDMFYYKLDYLDLPDIENGDKAMLDIIKAILENEGNKVSEIKSKAYNVEPLKSYCLYIITEQKLKEMDEEAIKND